MAYNDLKPLILSISAIGVLAVVLLTFIAITDGFGYSLRTPTDVALNGITIATNGSLTDFGSSYPYVQDVTGCVNATTGATLSTANYTIISGNAEGNGGFVLKDSGVLLVGDVVNCSSVDYRKSSTMTEQAEVFKLALAVIASFIGIIALAIIGKVIYRLVMPAKD